VIKELVSKTELNLKRGFVVSQLEDRWGVVLFEWDCEPGPRKIWSINEANLKPIGAFISLKVNTDCQIKQHPHFDRTVYLLSTGRSRPISFYLIKKKLFA